ncbi:SyrB-like regulator [Rhizobium sp. VS19-DR104.2]|uniref:SyrB-like regulator n=1 Tax=unclassified Rhizobium TaxID=2613769 RepID=UPI001CC6D188|nr:MULTISPECIES: SyrB-like regulator [unclassified Rhizobium]MBZ5762264.1 SyrB-like regulator [Rhizobium sp. VS19-DR96]MBZ5768280.1 SyrB-like regulator [Rhizobium sp. VS19-DR129.2]MBZ5775848.1 SyrB-like regulator [Rhizobium sp. VS19-DRK62.2]MBZ5787131.1 SyrB-like regulator [Rhizobium sp. VS19-DR121]MBZ5804206.1 SyrB-like regulator [Rhizobium sp. VS19-DR181]
MADENETTPAIEGTEASAFPAPEPKKQRKRRQNKVIAEAAALVSPSAVKSPRKKRVSPSIDTAIANTPAVSKSKPGKGRKPGTQPKAATPLPAAGAASDEMGDLIALEAENKCLRQALSEKLRGENADLRKKLGQA